MAHTKETPAKTARCCATFRSGKRCKRAVRMAGEFCAKHGAVIDAVCKQADDAIAEQAAADDADEADNA